MPKIRIKTVPKMQSGGYPPITDADRQAYNKYVHGMKKLPGYDAVNWQHDQTFQKNAAQQLGFDYSKAGAIQADMMTRNQMDPYAIKGIQGSDPWGGKPGWVGDRERQKEYRTFSYHGRRENPQTHVMEEYYNSGTPQFTRKTNKEYMSELEKARGNFNNQFGTTRQDEWENFGKPQANINYRGADAIYPENRIAESPTTPKPTGLAATGFPTREEAIAKYKTRKASGQELPSNYFLKGNPDYSIDTLRRTGKGSDEYAYGGNVTKRVRITGVPTMAEGGYANKSASHGYGNQQVGQSYALNRFWSSPAGYPGSTSQVNPYGKVGNTLPEAKDGGDINAEKQEMVLGDFDQDGQQELMNVDGPPHTEGGKDVNVPSNSFVFSDTKDLKIKDPQILAMFGMAPKRGGYTPAFIAKKYDLNKLKKILDDPNADELSKKTAQLMYDNYLSKLNRLAGVQEQMKAEMGMEHHDPERGQVPAQEPPVQIAGNMGPGGAEMMQPEVMAMYGGVPQYQRGGPGSYNKEEEEEGQDSEQYGVNTSMGMNDEYIKNPDGSYSIPNRTAVSTQSEPSNYLPQAQQTQGQLFPGATTGAGPITNVGMLSHNNPVDNRYDEMYRNILAQAQKNKKLKKGVDYGSDWISAQLAEPIMRAKGYTGPINTTDYNNWIHSNNQAYQTLGTGPNASAFGLRDALYQQPANLPKKQIDQVELKVPPPLQEEYPVPWAGNRVTPPTTPTKKEEGVTNRKQRRGIFANPNMYGDAMNLAQMLQLQKFVPYSPVPQAIIPPTVFTDPTRAIAAQQEAARNAMEMNNQSANSRAARANNLAVQGIAGTQAADIIGQYGNQNVAIANAANAQAAQITNQLMQMEANRLEELNKGNFLAARDYQREMGRLQAEWADRKQKQHDTAVKRAWLNKTSPYFDIGLNDMPVFKPGMDKKFYAELQGAPDPTIGQRIAEIMKEGANRQEAIEQVKLERGMASTKRTDPLTGAVTTSKGAAQETKYGGMMRYGGSHMAMPQMAPQYQIGGSALSLPAIDNTAYSMSPQSFEPMQANSEENPLSGLPTKKASRRDIATITNNPGNIIYTPKFAKLFGAIDSGIKQSDGKGHFAMFPDLNTGFTAYQTQLFGDVDGVMKSNYYKKDTTVDQALKTWSNKGYDGNIYPEIKNKKLGELTMAERNELAKRQIKHESGDMYRLLRERGVFKYGGSALQKFIR